MKVIRANPAIGQKPVIPLRTYAAINGADLTLARLLDFMADRGLLTAEDATQIITGGSDPNVRFATRQVMVLRVNHDHGWAECRVTQDDGSITKETLKLDPVLKAFGDAIPPSSGTVDQDGLFPTKMMEVEDIQEYVA